MPERDYAERRAEIKRKKRLRRAQKRFQKHARKRESLSQPPASPPGYLGRMKLFLGLLGADFFSRAYKTHGIEFLSSYGHDVLAIPIWWLGTQGIFFRSEFFRSKKNILLPLALSAGFEGMEYVISQMRPEVMDQHLLGSARFDPWDFAAYGVGAAATLRLHRIFYGRTS